jgi:5,6-dimethylbenzimidazole synthase
MGIHILQADWQRHNLTVDYPSHAIQNLWLAARAERIVVGWVSILSDEDLHKILNIPENSKLVAYLCLGYVEVFADKPDLEKAGWLPKLELDKVVYYDQLNGEVKDT